MKKKKSKALGETTGKAVKNSSFCTWDGESLVLNILGKPGAKRDAIGKIQGKQLKVSVKASPVAGKATHHMVKFLAAEFGVSTHDITVVFGRLNVNKQIRINAPQKLPPVIAKAFSKS